MNMNQTENISDVIIIGGGPTGLFAAFYGGMQEMSVKVIDSLPQLGGQLRALYPEKYIYDVAGSPKILAKDLVHQLEEQANQFDPEMCLEENVQNVEKLEEHLFKVTTTKAIHYTKTVLITSGAGAFQPRRLKHELADKYEGKNLFYSITDLQAHKGQRVCISGGGDSAVDWALMLSEIAEETTLVHRRNQFRAHEHSINQLKETNVKIKTPMAIDDLVGTENQIQSVVLKETKGDKSENLEVDALIVNHGFLSSLGAIKEWGLEIEKNSIVVNQKMETNIPGIYAAGDITTYDGKVKLIATGFGEAPTAISQAKHYIDPHTRVQPPHSTRVLGGA
ncbi:NAD(P)/FAD-dependent oxidoreductase [Halobacillus karajensis]|uniref:Ferredoxin--NADP reductase n=1 Tax=Halobacillus karajensis TaxID=195088 RepID=A0A024P4X8_9BACI|nr:NAD(P)/FAD-dependent oxidoreductase [Halobacillus karajensis]CDQ20697.1 Ferredoxin--NADP reductase 2 [Halobacillus karajensis]CDQ23833.1 Ferredoxin--NADP reductase 2 [Halobacillus karajensis]CDQ27311.1 Ferredoxin--NADP reductase 2 [Halobacillus karajensis]